MKPGKLNTFDHRDGDGEKGTFTSRATGMPPETAAILEKSRTCTTRRGSRGQNSWSESGMSFHFWASPVFLAMASISSRSLMKWDLLDKGWNTKHERETGNH